MFTKCINIDPWKSTDQTLVRPKGTREDHTLQDETTVLNRHHPLGEGNDTNKALPVVDHLPRSWDCSMPIAVARNQYVEARPAKKRMQKSVEEQERPLGKTGMAFVPREGPPQAGDYTMALLIPQLLPLEHGCGKKLRRPRCLLASPLWLVC